MTPLIAASASSTFGLVVVAGLLIVGYFLACAAYPFGKCRRCSGLGRHHSPGRAHWRDCKRCVGTGARVRVGRRIYMRLRGHERTGR
jgi:hypothetical protein